MRVITGPVKQLLAAATVCAAFSAQAALVIPGADGSDGAFAPATNTVVDLGSSGAYDAANWAVVYKYSSVDIPAGVTVTFLNHPSRAAVVWLVSGDVTIDGALDLSGENGSTTTQAEPGPGGFRGGSPWLNNAQTASGGFGIGGAPATYSSEVQRSGSHATQGYQNPGPTYGNPRIMPLIGGSGGSGDYYYEYARGGGAGGGSILIAATGTITVNGTIYANGGNAGDLQRTGGGAGGVVRLIADTVAGTGSILAIGGSSQSGAGGLGRIRVETQALSGNINAVPGTALAEPDNPVLIWPPSTVPSASVISIDTETVPGDPNASFALGSTDVSLPELATSDIVVETKNIDPTGTVQVRIAPRHGAPYFVSAAHTSGDITLSTWTASAALPPDVFTVQALAENP